MKKVIFSYETQYNGKTDSFKKELDLEFQAGNNQASDEMQKYNMLTSLSLSYLDFMFKLGYEPLDAHIHIEKLVQEMLEDEETPEPGLIPAPDQLDFDSFVAQFNKSSEFKEKMFEIFQMYMTDTE